MLVNRKQPGRQWGLGTTDLTAWAEVAHVTTPAFTRSFTALDGDLCFGLGSEVEDPKGLARTLTPETRTVLRLPGKPLSLVDR